MSKPKVAPFASDDYAARLQNFKVVELSDLEVEIVAGSDGSPEVRIVKDSECDTIPPKGQ